MLINMIFVVSCLPILPILYYFMKNESEPKKNIVLGVTLPYAHLNDEEVTAIRRAYKRCLNRVTLIFALLVPIPFLVHSFSINFTLWMVWILGIIFATTYPYIKYNKELRSVKFEKQWLIENAGYTMVDMKAVSERVRTLRIIFFLPPIIVSMVPVIVEIVERKETKNFGILIFPLLLISMLSILFFAVGMLMDSQRSELICMNSDININYTRAKKRNWSKCWLYTCWLSAGFAIAFWAFLKGNILNPFQFILITMLYTTGILILCVVTALRIYRLRHRIQPDDQTDVLNDEDAYWIMGMFYYNPNSKRTMVEKRVGIGTTVNMATKAGKILTFIGALSILLIPVCCVWLMFEEFTPIHVKLSDGEVISEQWKEEYTIPLKEIEEVTLLTELPDTSKISGSGLENLKKGTFSVKGYGDCELLLNPKNEVFLVIKTDKDTYIFSDTEDKGTKELYDEIAIGKSR